MAYRRARAAPLVIPFTKTCNTDVKPYIQAFTTCNKLLPSPFIINGKEMLL